jgi:hypothetical protein
MTNSVIDIYIRRSMAIPYKEPGITKVYRPSEKENDHRKHLYERKQDMADARAPEENNWEKWQKQWEAWRPPKGANDWLSDIYIPITTSIIEAQLSEIINQELKPWVIARGVEDESKATVMNAILEYTWDVSKSDLALFDIIKDSLIFGTGIGQEYYWKQPRTIRTADGKTQEVIEYDDCFLEAVRLQDFYKDEKGRSFFGPYACRDAIRRYVMNYEDFRNFFKGPIWDPMGNAALVKPGGDTNYYEFFKPPEGMNHNKEVEVLWYWNKPDDCLDIVANDVMVRMGPNPNKHKQLGFVRAVDVKRPYQFYGKGEAELLESLQEETNTIRRMLIDRNHLDLDKPVFASDTLTIEDEDAIAGPHKIINVSDVNAIKFPEYSDVSRSVFDTLTMLNDDKVRVTGMDERQQSVASAGTATEAAILKEATLKRINMKIWNIKNDTLVDIGRLRVANIMQFYSQPKIEKIVGEIAIGKAKAEGTLFKVKGETFKTSFRNIRLQDKKLDLNPTTGDVRELPSRGNSFFEARPEFFMPTYGGFDIRYKATSSMPISKPLEQQKTDEMYDRLITNPTVDPWKLAELELKSRDKDPEAFKIMPPGQQKLEGAQLQKMIDLAGMENDEMVRGNEIGPTPYASPAHTEIHIAYIKSEQFKKDVPVDDEKIIQIFTNHVMGEIMAETARESGGQQGQPDKGGQMPPGAQPGMPGAPQDMAMQDVAPSRIMGGNEVQSGVQGPQSGMTGK